MGFWRGQRALVTGGAGFIGRQVIIRLQERGCSVISAPRRSEYDLGDLDAVTRRYDDVRPTLIIHLAATVGGIGADRARPAEFFFDNLMMGTQLLDQVWRKDVPKFVAIGTVCAYPKCALVPFREEDLGTATRKRRMRRTAWRFRRQFRSFNVARHPARYPEVRRGRRRMRVRGARSSGTARRA